MYTIGNKSCWSLRFCRVVMSNMTDPCIVGRWLCGGLPAGTASSGDLLARALNTCHHWSSSRRSWRYQMETFSALLALCEGNPPVTGGSFSSQRPVTRSFDVFFDLRLNKRLSKQLRRRWFETPSRSLWRYCNDRILTSHDDAFRITGPLWGDSSHKGSVMRGFDVFFFVSSNKIINK